MIMYTNQGLTNIPGLWSYYVSGSSAVLPIYTRLNRFNVTDISNTIQQLQGAEIVKNIVLDFDCPGGETHGLMDTAKYIFQMRGEKPIYAFSAGFMTSGAYILASGCKKIFVSHTAKVGSIGVASSYADYTDYYKKVGIEIKHFHNTDANRKNSNPIHDKQAAKRVQQSLDYTATIVHDFVATARNMTKENLIKKAGDADIYTPDEAIEKGLIDGILTKNELIEKLQSKGENMKLNNQSENPPKASSDALMDTTNSNTGNEGKEDTEGAVESTFLR